MIITDGTTEIDLRKNGYRIQNVSPQIGGHKSAFQESGMSNGRVLISKHFNLNTLSISVIVEGEDQSEAFLKQNRLIKLLRKSVDFWNSSRAQTPVYVKDQAPGETNIRYAAIYECRINQATTIMAQPFDQPGCKAVSTIQFEVGLENWKSSAPSSYSSISITTDRTSCSGEEFETTVSNIGSQYSAMAQLANGRVLAYEDLAGEIHYSDDLGKTFTLLSSLPGITAVAQGRDMAVCPNGIVLLTTTSTTNASDRGLWRSTNSGASWSKVANPHGSYRGFFSIYVDEDVAIVSGTGTSSAENQLLASNNHFSLSLTQVWWTADNFPSVFRASDGSYYAVGDSIVRSTNPESTWSLIGLGTPFNDGVLKVLRNGERIYIIMEGRAFVWYIDQYITSANWKGISLNSPTTEFPGIIGIFNNRLYAGFDGAGFYFSANGDTEMVQLNSYTSVAGTNAFRGITDLIDDNKFLISWNESSAGSISRVKPCYTVGNSTQKYITSGYQSSNVTHIKHYDDSTATYTDLFNNDGNYELYPSPAANDYLYIGVASDSAYIETAPPFIIAFDLSVGASGITFNSDWEYHSGSTWVSISSYDSTGANRLEQSGIVMIGIDTLGSPGFGVATVDGVSGFWVRLGISSVSSPTSPTVLVNPYAVNNPWIEIPDIGGDLNSYIKVSLSIDSDQPEALPDEAQVCRLIAGARSLSRGDNFRAYLGPKQLPTGITTTLGTDSTETTDNKYSSYGAYILYSSVITDSWQDVISYVFDVNTISQYFGLFRVFIRGFQFNGTSGQMSLRYSFQYGTGGLVTVGRLTGTPILSANLSFGLFDLGLIKIPTLPSSSSNSAATSTLTIQLYQTSATPDFYMFDTILIPADEWICDYVSKEQLTARMGFGYEFEFQNGVKTVSENRLFDDTPSVVDSWFDNAISEPQLRTGNQSVWFLPVCTNGTINQWISPRYTGFNVEVESQKRYLIGRGSG